VLEEVTGFCVTLKGSHGRNQMAVVIARPCQICCEKRAGDQSAASSGGIGEPPGCAHVPDQFRATRSVRHVLEVALGQELSDWSKRMRVLLDLSARRRTMLGDVAARNVKQWHTRVEKLLR